MTFTLPDLPYAYDALQPYMSKETLEFHHDKHHQAYVTAGNNLMKGSEFEDKPVEEVVKGAFGKNIPLFNNAGQHYNHIHFWKWMKPNGGGDKLPGALEKKVTEDLGGLAKMKEDFVAAGVGQFGSGWAWLAVQNGKIVIMKTAERREPARARRVADPGLRRVGALLLHRLPQSPPRLPESLPRPPRELGARRGDADERDEITTRDPGLPWRASSRDGAAAADGGSHRPRVAAVRAFSIAERWRRSPRSARRPRRCRRSSACA